MQLPDEAPKLPKLPFFIGDALLIATALVVVQRSASPLSAQALLAIVACVGLGAILAVIPFLVDYARRQDAALLERQNSLEALARTASSAAEQIGIAAAGLHTIGELVHKNLRMAEQLPHKLQERINEFNQQRDEAIVAENEALTQEVNSLRASEAEKLESAATQIHKTAAELAKTEATLHKHLGALREAVDRLPAAIDQAGTRAGQSVVSAGDDIVARLLAEIDAHLAAAAGSFAARAAAAAPTAAAPKAPRKPAAPAAPATVAAEVASAPAPSAPEAAAPATDVEPPTPPLADPPPATSPAASVPPPPAPAATATATAATAEPDAEGAETVAASPKPAARKRARKERSAEAPDLPGFLVEEEPGHATAVAVADEADEPAREGGELERSLSADGVTRLIVTAYIGIGNRLFVRGEGPGLSRDQGVPLQFVSIGKWRWESAEANVPVRLRVFKNDQAECASLGEIVLEPGQQGEVTANF